MSMSTTPIYDFINNYNSKDCVRLHMPGHKGKGFLGFEAHDITEIDGADVLYHSNGIIRQSEDIASGIFNTKRTLYSTEGSSLCIRAMLYLALLKAKKNERPVIFAGRNAHKVFITTSALLDFDIKWLYPEKRESAVCCEVSPEKLDFELTHADILPIAVYITSPDYLGNIADIQGLSQICHKHNTILIVDNAHGAYLNFLDKSLHPIPLGADLCCDSAHKTLPVLTGGAYLHISKTTDKLFFEHAENAMSLFSSTSPSYLILESLDLANKYLLDGFEKDLSILQKELKLLKQYLTEKGYELIGDEPLKLTIHTKAYGYTGHEIYKLLEEKDIICEFADKDYLVMMFSTQNPPSDFEKVKNILTEIPRKESITTIPPESFIPKSAMSPRKALFIPSVKRQVKDCLGKVLCSVSISCPPAIPFIVCGEIINEKAIKLLEYYGVTECYTEK